MRCIKFWLQGALWRRPVPYFRDFTCWASGQRFSCGAMFAAVPVVIFLAGFFAGRNF